MKRSKEVVKGQVEGEVKRSKSQAAEESSESAPELNPFLVEPVLVKLLKLVEEVSQLKELRKMCQTWDEFNLKELEERAFNGKVKAIDFSWEKQTKLEAEGSLVQFLGETSAIPRLFHSFKFYFPESWTFLCKHMEFFSNYPVTFVNLSIPFPKVVNLAQRKETWDLLTKFMETELWGNLKEITLSKVRGVEGRIEQLPSSSLFVPSSGSIQRKLQKLDLKICNPEIFQILVSDFASGKYINLKSMELSKLPGGNLDIPGLDLTKLTRLEIGEIEYGGPPALKCTSCLINLAGNGMKLKNFGISVNLTPEEQNDAYFFVNLPLICSNFTQFFSTQSSTLETLNFDFDCHLETHVDMPEGAEISCKIHLPMFKVLHSLQLKVDLEIIEAEGLVRTHSQLFGMTQNLAVHFPKLVNLTLERECSLTALRVNPTPDEAGQLQLERLEIYEFLSLIIPYDSTLWSTSFVGLIGSVKGLKCPAKLLFGERLPWAESLHALAIYNLNLEIDEQEIFKLNHFKKLERLTTMYFDIDGRQIRGGHHGRYGSRDVDDYLNTFKEATELPLKFIKFIGPNMEEEMKEEFNKYFPFPVEFQVDPSLKLKWLKIRQYFP